MSVTQKEIAEKLNISQTHVARALSGSTLVSEKTRLRIEAAAREMGYDPDAHIAARSLIARRHNKPSKKGTIAMLYEFLGASPRDLPYFTSFLQGVEEQAATIDTNLCLCLMREAELPHLIRQRNVDGVVMLSGYPKLVQEIKALGVPVVTFQAQQEGVCSVRPDDLDGARQAARHLVEQGHRRIGYMGVELEDSAPSSWRYQGYLTAMKECGLAVRDEWVVTSYGVPVPTTTTYCQEKGHCNRCTGCMGWAALMEQHHRAGRTDELPTALVCYNDMVAMGVAEHASQDGVVIPRDLSLIGFDDVSTQYNFEPALTSVVLPLREMGQSAVKILEALRAGSLDGDPQNSVLPVSLTVRDSTPALESVHNLVTV